MPRNVEIKARVRDRAALLARAEAQQPHEAFLLEQRDTFFHCPEGRLKLREFPDRQAELIFYTRPDQSGPKLSSYSRCPVANPQELRDTLAQAYGIRGEVKKTRQVYLVGQTRVHVDQVEGLGDFMELEVVLEDAQSLEEGVAIADALRIALGVAESDLIDGAYMDLLSVD